MKLTFLWITFASLAIFRVCHSQEVSTEHTVDEVTTTLATHAASETASQPKATTTLMPIWLPNDVCNTSMAAGSDDEKKFVKCSCNGYGLSVDCSHLEITVITPNISFPKAAHFASFLGNRISNLNQDTFYNARELLSLNLAHNQIDFISVNSFLAFKKLLHLDLSHNRIWNLPVATFKELASLEVLDLSYNDLINVFPSLFAPLTGLKDLNLESNPLQELEPKHFEHLSKLESLNLKATLLKVIPDHVFIFTPKLKTLYLANNQLDDIPSEAFKALDKLRTLDISGNPIQVVKGEAFAGMRGLVILYMDRMLELTKVENYAFGDLEHLQELHCSYNPHLSEFHEFAFVRKVDNHKVQISQLFLRQNDLSTLSSSLFWNNDVELQFGDNPVLCDCRIQWMVNIKLKNDFQSHVRCIGPAAYQDKLMSTLKGHNLSCGLELSDIIMIVCAVVAAILILVLIVSFLVWRKGYRGYSKPYYPKKRHVQDIDYKGDDDF